MNHNKLKQFKTRGLFFLIIILSFQNCKISHTYNAQNYDTYEILNKFNSVLNEFAPEYSTVIDGGFSNTKEGLPMGYTIFDLNDPDNYSILSENKSISFNEGHFYHFSSIFMDMSFSHIAYLDKGKVIIFKAVNCFDKGDDFNELIDFANKKLENNPHKKEIMERIQNYRNYGLYSIVDIHSMNVNCDCSPCE